MKKALLDTCLLVEGQVSHPDFIVAVSSMTWAELGFGVRKAANPIERANRELRLSRLQAVLGSGIPFDDAAARAYEVVCGMVLASGRQVRARTVDLMIAATAVANGAVLITKNPKDFKGLEDLLEIIPA